MRLALSDKFRPVLHKHCSLKPIQYSGNLVERQTDEGRQMALPPDCVGPVCDAFLQRAEKLLSAPEPGSCSISNVQYCVLTIELLAEENEHALLHVTSILFEQQNRFMKAAFKFVLCGK